MRNSALHVLAIYHHNWTMSANIDLALLRYKLANLYRSLLMYMSLIERLHGD